MFTSFKFMVAASIVMSCAGVSPAFAQQGTAGHCAPVTARNPQEALMMEGTSHRSGCWTRTASGQLVFVSNDAPDKAYKPLIAPVPSSGCVPRLRGAGVAPRSNGDLSGSWQFMTGVWPGESELALIQLGSRLGSDTKVAQINGCQAVDLDSFTGSITRRGAQFCFSENGEQICLDAVGPSTYRQQNGTWSCTYEVEGDTLRGACSDSAIPGRVVLTQARRSIALGR